MDLEQLSNDDLIWQAKMIESQGWHPNHSQNQLARALRELLAYRTAAALAVPDDVAELVQRGRTSSIYCWTGEESELPKLLADALEAQAAELARLRADIDQGAKDYCDLMEQRDALHVRVKALEAALRPFVAYVHDDFRKGKTTYELVAVDRHGGGLIGAEDLRRARAALTHPTGV